MIIDHRTYDFHPGKIDAWVALYRDHGLPVQERHLNNLLGFFTTEIGPINQAVFMWAYDNLADREVRRAAMAQDPDWIAYKKKSGAMGALRRQQNKILRPADFSPIR